MPLLESIGQDTRYALRKMRGSLGLTLVAIFSLALGIGSSLAIFSVANALLLKRLPVPDPDQLMEVARSGSANVHTTAIWRQIWSQQDVFSSVFAYASAPFDLAAAGDKHRVWGLLVSGDYFKTLRVSPVLGRPLADSDDQRGSAPVCVISYGMWQRQYGGSPAAIGSRLNLDGVSFEIVGVAPRGFFGLDVGESFDVIVPLETERLIHPQQPALDQPRVWWLSAVGRLKPGITVAQADARLRVLGPAIFRASLPPGADESDWQSLLQKTLIPLPMPNGVSWARYLYGQAVLLLLALVGAVLLIACANLTNLLLARAAKRQREIATRLALGAGRWRLVRQLFTEGTLLCCMGVACGLLFARWASQALVLLVSSRDAAITLDLTWDLRVVAFSIGVTILCVLLLGLAPALGATRFSLDLALRRGPLMIGGAPRFSGSSLIVFQVALSTALLISSGQLMHTLQRLMSQDLGYQPKGVLLVSVAPEPGGEPPERLAYLGEQLLAEFRSLPGIVSAARSANAGARAPLLLSRMPDGTVHRSGGHSILVSPAYFKTRQTSLPAGRDFGPEDTATSTAVAILSVAAAQTLFPGVSPLGLTVELRDPGTGVHAKSLQVVGIAGDVQYRRPFDAALPVVYLPISQCPATCALPGSFALRFAAPVSEVKERVRTAARNVNAHLALDFRLLSDDAYGVIGRERMTAALSAVFSLVTLLLAAIGLYGITAFRASQRTFEIGVRRALGAQPENVLSMILGETLGRVAAGVALGALAGFGAARTIQGILYGVVPADPLTFGLAACLMFAVAIMAAFLPARRASQADPVSALRAE